MKKTLLGIVILAFVLVGCSSQALTLAPKESAISDCAPGDGPVSVAQQDTEKEVSCKLSGIDLVFLDGRLFSVDKGAASGSTVKQSKGGHTIYTFYDVRIYGIVAGVGNTGYHTNQGWGSATGKKKVREAFGKNWTCDR